MDETSTPASAAQDTGPPGRDLPVIDLNLGKAKAGKEAVEIDEGDRLQFARHILAFLFIICLIVFAGYYFQPESKAAIAIFELVKIGVLPLVTLVIGFYFPNSNNKK